MKILITNYSLRKRAGTELYVRDLAFGLLKLGHIPIVYTTETGPVADEIRQEKISVVDDLSTLSITPDVIHGHHSRETMTALLSFPGVPAIYVCHDWYWKLDAPPKFPRILRYVGVDEMCYDKLVCENGIPEQRARLVPSFVDLDRFKPRAPLPALPKRALILCNYAEELPHLAAAREACAARGIKLDAMGAQLGKPCDQPEKILGDYDIVLAKGRTALEAMACGTAVILHVQQSLGPMVTAADLDRLLPLNCGVRAMTLAASPESFARALIKEVERYDAEDAALVSRRVRATCGRDRAVAEFVSLYEEVISENRDRVAPDQHQEATAAAAYLREFALDLIEEERNLHSSKTYRLNERLKRLPLFGRLSH